MGYVYALMVVGIIAGIALEAYLEAHSSRRNNGR